jgi:hypothetical protein
VVSVDKNCQLSAEVIDYSNLYWPSLNCSYNNVDYWKEMWALYGTCSGLSQSAWFKLAIKLFQPEFTEALLSKGTTTFSSLSQETGWTNNFSISAKSLHETHIRHSKRSDVVHHQGGSYIRCYKIGLEWLLLKINLMKLCIWPQVYNMPIRQSYSLLIFCRYRAWRKIHQGRFSESFEPCGWS